MSSDLEERIKKRAYALWQEEGCPAGREHDHWDRARILVAIEDDRTALKPVELPKPEEAELQKNLGEFPGAFTDQGDEQAFPSRDAPAEPKKQAPTKKKIARKK